MEFLSACEDLAANITAFDAANSYNSHISEEDILRWQNLFTLSREEATSAIKEWRSCLNPNSFSDEAWATIQEPKSQEGHTKESYEWSISQQASAKPLQTQNNNLSIDSHNKMTLLKLDKATFSTASQIQALADLDRVPLTLSGTDDDNKPVRFCLLDSRENALVTRALSSLTLLEEPTRIPVSIAEKNLSRHSVHPFLGIDTTLPHYRPTQEEYVRCLPSQDQFPVWYFFYGTLGEPFMLDRVLGYEQEIDCLKKASVRGGRLSTWGGKYKAMVDEPGGQVDGWAYLVKTEEDEQALRVYETANYEVVRCLIKIENGQEVRGLTFRYIVSK